MANRQIQKYQPRAQIADTPDYVVAGGDIAQTLTALGGNAAGRLRQMADNARAKEGEMAGMNAGQVAGAGYIERQASIAAASGTAIVSGELVVKSGDLNGVNSDLLDRMKKLQGAFGAPLPIISGYRDPARNAKVGGAKSSQHLHGGALDIDLTGVSQQERQRLIQTASAQGFTGIGVYDNSLHLDMGARRAWGPSYKRASVPAWASGAIDAHLAGGAKAPPPEAPATGGLNPQPLALRNDNTIYGDNFDAAAIRTYGWRLQEGVSNDLGAAYEQNKDDPAAWNKALGDIRDKYSQDGNFNDPRVRDVFDKTFAERSQTYTSSVTQRSEARLIADQSAAFGSGLDAMRGDLEKQAYLLGANPDGDAILATQSARILNNIDHAQATNVISSSAAAAERDKLNTTLAYARTNGVFAALPSPAAKQAFANDLLTEWAAGKGPLTKLGFNQVKALADQLSAQALISQNQQTAATKADRSAVQGLIENDIASIAATGMGIDTVANGLTPDRIEALGLDPAAWSAARDRARQGWEATAGMEAETPAELNDRLAALAPVPGAPDFVQQSEIYAQAVAQAQDVHKRRAIDPLGQAAKAGAIKLEPIDFTTADGMASSLQLRAQQGKAVGDMYGMAPSYFRPEERAAIANALLDNPAMLPGFAASVASTFGDGASTALSELSDAGPELAHAAGITLATGDTSVATDVARVLAGRRDKTINVKMPTDAVMTTAAANVIGSAMAQNPATRAAVTNVAGMLFEGQAAAMGFDPADIKTEGSAAYLAYQHAVNRALGSSLVNGQQYGGLAMVNGQEIVAPTQMAADRVEPLLRSLRAEDLTIMAPIRSGNGIEITAGDLQNGRLLTIGDGQYAVSLGDPASLTPNLVMGSDGQPWVLDLYALEQAAASRPTPNELQQGINLGLGASGIGSLFKW
jgi:hypothetical protein